MTSTQAAEMLRRKMERNNPEELLEMEKAGTLEDYLDDQANVALDRIQEWMDQGIPADVAQEMAIEELLA